MPTAGAQLVNLTGERTPLGPGMSSMDVNLADLVGAVADAMPDRSILVCDGDRLSYRQLMDRASQLAQHLIASGLRPDETVGLYMLSACR